MAKENILLNLPDNCDTYQAVYERYKNRGNSHRNNYIFDRILRCDEYYPSKIIYDFTDICDGYIYDIDNYYVSLYDPLDDSVIFKNDNNGFMKVDIQDFKYNIKYQQYHYADCWSYESHSVIKSRTTFRYKIIETILKNTGILTYFIDDANIYESEIENLGGIIKREVITNTNVGTTEIKEFHPIRFICAYLYKHPFTNILNLVLYASIVPLTLRKFDILVSTTIKIPRVRLIKKTTRNYSIMNSQPKITAVISYNLPINNTGVIISHILIQPMNLLLTMLDLKNEIQRPELYINYKGADLEKINAVVSEDPTLLITRSNGRMIINNLEKTIECLSYPFIFYKSPKLDTKEMKIIDDFMQIKTKSSDLTESTYLILYEQSTSSFIFIYDNDLLNLIGGNIRKIESSSDGGDQTEPYSEITTGFRNSKNESYIRSCIQSFYSITGKLMYFTNDTDTKEYTKNQNGCFSHDAMLFNTDNTYATIVNKKFMPMTFNCCVIDMSDVNNKKHYIFAIIGGGIELQFPKMRNPDIGNKSTTIVKIKIDDINKACITCQSNGDGFKFTYAVKNADPDRPDKYVNFNWKYAHALNFIVKRLKPKLSNA